MRWVWWVWWDGGEPTTNTHEQQPKPRSHNEVGVVCAVRRGGANHRTNQQGRQVTGIGYLIDLAVPPAAQNTGRGFREKPYFGRRFYIKRFFLNCRFRILNPVFWPNSLTLEGRFRRQTTHPTKKSDLCNNHLLLFFMSDSIGRATKIHTHLTMTNNALQNRPTRHATKPLMKSCKHRETENMLEN